MKKISLGMISAFFIWGFSSCSGTGPTNFDTVQLETLLEQERPSPNLLVLEKFPARPIKSGLPYVMEKVPNQEKAPDQGKHLLVSGTLEQDPYTGSEFRIEIRQAIACDEGFCPDLNALSLASITLVRPGFFSLVVPREAGEKFLTVTEIKAKGTGQIQKIFLGPLENRLYDLRFHLDT